MTRVGVLGAKGRMGGEVCRTVEAAPDLNWPARSTRATRSKR